MLAEVARAGGVVWGSSPRMNGFAGVVAGPAEAIQAGVAPHTSLPRLLGAIYSCHRRRRCPTARRD
eukprot:11155029-Lingulodinium_polyedra.AAC.1